jgi:predicted RNA-binding Zn-ribbon protein involved in translation (DUF1610 family)
VIGALLSGGRALPPLTDTQVRMIGLARKGYRCSPAGIHAVALRSLEKRRGFVRQDAEGVWHATPAGFAAFVESPHSAKEPWAALSCRSGIPFRSSTCGEVEISRERYDAEMRKPNQRWRCPVCDGAAEYDDARSEVLQGIDPDLQGGV